MITILLKNCQKEFIRKSIACMMALAMIIAMFTPIHSQAAVQKVKVYYNGSKKATSVRVINYTYQNKKVNLGKSPIIMINNYYGMAPYTMAFVKNGPKVKHSLNKTKGILILKYKGITLKFKNKSKTAYINGKPYKLSIAPAYAKYASTKKTYFMIPLRQTCEMLGLNYSYTAKTSLSKISVPSVKKPEEATTQAPQETTTEATETTTEEVKPTVEKKTQATIFKSMTPAQLINYVGPLAKADYKKSGIRASVTMAQFILESGWGKSELAQKANNMFGMKTNLSGNTWTGSVWDGTSQYVKKTGEEVNGKHITITAAFRAYPSVERSIADHSAYLLGARNGSSLRYAGIAKASSYKKQIQIIKDGGYATSSGYVSSVCNLIETYHLDQWDK